MNNRRGVVVGEFAGFRVALLGVLYSLDFVLQAPAIVVVSVILLYQIHMESLVKFGLASIIVLPLTWGLAHLLRKIPYADRVL